MLLFPACTAGLTAGLPPSGTAELAQSIPAPSPGPSPAETLAVVPRAKRVVRGRGDFRWGTSVVFGVGTDAARVAARVLTDFARSAGLHVTVGANEPGASIVFRAAGATDDAGPEGYTLSVSSERILIAASQRAGFDYAVQTLMQITATHAVGRVETPALSVRDWPSYRWRGIHLDVSRHFFALPTLERYIDLAQRYKLNVFHWHLTDDEGWRIEIKRRPLLTSGDSCKALPGGCAFYSQAEIRALVAYAHERDVLVVPEIDVPGHSGAAIRAYPELACEGRPGAKVMCPSEKTFAFLDDVLAEVTELFPGPFVHLGGDEVSPRNWRESRLVDRLMRDNHLATYPQVQAYMMTRLARSVERRGKRAVMWDDALAGPIPQDVVVTAWRGEPAEVLGVTLGHDVVASPDGPLYFDGYQGDADQEPPAMRYRATLEQVYRHDPVSAALPAAARDHVVGVQANVWSEQIATPDHLFYMLLPRELALAETGWAGTRTDEWPGFRERLPAQLAWLSSHGYSFRVPDVEYTFSERDVRFSPLGASVESGSAATTSEVVHVTIDAPVAGEIRFTTDGSSPTDHAPRYTSPLAFRLANGERLQLRAAAFAYGRRGAVSRCTVSRVAVLAPVDGRRTFASWSALVSAQPPGVYHPPSFP